MDSSDQVVLPASVVDVFRAAALVPSPPLLVPELTGSSVDETADLRSAALDAVTYLTTVTERWIALGVDAGTSTYGFGTTGTLREYGVDVTVSLSAGPPVSVPDATLPLTVLIAGWLRGRAAPDVDIEVRTVAADSSARWCEGAGSQLRRELDASDTDWGVLVLADGANTLTPKAPGSFDERAEQVQRGIDDALEAGDVGALSTLDVGLCSSLGIHGRAAWQVLAALAKPPMTSRELYRGKPFGVGYFVGTWSRV